ncbi:MAG: acyl-CoA dehydrogenase, partial [Rhodospirillaceae bacterium]|nr:acyl-CoA dehydrogenase [Rhodospirillaceae bacterium]
AVGWLIGEENRGLNAMFVMMNNARLSVGLQGVAIGERAYQQARDFAKERVQSRDLAGSAGPVTIVHHPDVRRMLLTMRAITEAGRALTYYAGGKLDMAKRAPDADAQAAAQARVDLLTPVVKAWCSDGGVDIASLGVQVHGGMGYVEETGAAQHLRDARICPIYEGTNGIQAADLAFRKVMRDKGTAARTLFAEMRGAAAAEGAGPAGAGLVPAVAALEEATEWMVGASAEDAAAAATPYLKLFGIVTGGWTLARQAAEANARLAAGNGDAGFLKAKLATAQVYADALLPQASGLAQTAMAGARGLMDVPEDAL